ncbi:hypothetical protein NEOLEDRAFT_1172905 [Neolentinus lepideus HHB14362 ss-1]|uniref:Aminoglycoside phosphotransferase domain-containing protein n=1 Tax=Neolentinus lepideus HHB14362 ss-1 TaxID=1314782 RepID=A0A165NIA5_9AGAM|nr:hypothetical protein NEOLEDRAFT_1172905 [Neolentinus lepideus HHB14362 ss-1]
MFNDDFTSKQVFLGKIKEVFIAHFHTPLKESGSTRREISQIFVCAVLKASEFLRLSSENKDDHGFMTVWTRRPKVHQIDIWYSFINYAEAIFLGIQQNMTVNDCRSLEELKPLAENAQWCESMSRLNVSKWSEDVVGIDTLANWPAGPRSRVLTVEVFQVDDRYIVKLGLSVTIKEVMAMEYVRRNTTIPVLRVYGPVGTPGQPSFGRGSNSGIIAQLLSYVREIRSLERDRGEVGSWPSGLPYCGLFRLPPSSPITSLAKLYSYWEERWEAAEEYRMKWPLMGKTDGNENMVLSHGELAPRNIIVKGPRIASIVDRGTFGWYPDFWEGMMARRYLNTECTWWERVSDAMEADGEVAESFWQIIQSVLNRN